MPGASFDDFTRLQRELAILREAIEGRALANPESVSGVARTAPRSVPPKVSGLARTTNVNTIHLTWNASTATNLLRYEVEVATDENFTERVKFASTRAKEWTYQEGDPDTTYYARVRAVGHTPGGQREGPWSATVNTSTGKAVTANLTVGAVNELHSFVQTSGFTAMDTAVTNPDDETYGPLSITVVRAGSIVIPRFVFEVDIGSNFATPGDTNRVSLELRRRQANDPSDLNDVVVDSIDMDFFSDLPASRMGIPAFTTFDQPGAGDWEYRVNVELTSSGSSWITLTGVSLTLEFIQTK